MNTTDDVRDFLTGLEAQSLDTAEAQADLVGQIATMQSAWLVAALVLTVFTGIVFSAWVRS